MADNNFDYKMFSEETIERISSSLPTDINNEIKSFICDIVKQFINTVGELLKKKSFTYDQQKICCQVVVDWILYTSVDMIRGNLPDKYRVHILESIATLTYEIMRQGYTKSIDEDEIMAKVKYYADNLFRDKIDELYAKNLIDKNIYARTLARVNFDKAEYHTNCYSLGDKEEKELLNDRIAIAFAQNLAYRYLMKAAHC